VKQVAIAGGALAFALLVTPARAAEGELLIGTDIEPIYANLIYPEGLVFDGNALLLTDMKLGAVLRMTGGKPAPVWRDERCGPTSLAKLPSGQWLVACHLSQQLVVLDLAGGTATETARVPFARPNDMYAGPNGVYVSRSGEFSRSAEASGEVWLVRSPADMRRVVSRIHYANGVAVTRDGHALLVSEHLEGRVWRYPIMKDGSLGSRALAYAGRLPESGPLSGPDGIEPAADGSFFVAWYWVGTILHVDANGHVIDGFFLPGRRKVTNVALTPDGHGLYAVATDDNEIDGALYFVDLRNPLSAGP
jgi:sugar lactone lactonase YvrE